MVRLSESSGSALIDPSTDAIILGVEVDYGKEGRTP
jgi:hypothetical protein